MQQEVVEKNDFQNHLDNPQTEETDVFIHNLYFYYNRTLSIECHLVTLYHKQ